MLVNDIHPINRSRHTQTVTPLSPRQNRQEQGYTTAQTDPHRDTDRHRQGNNQIHKIAFSKTIIWTQTTDGQRMKAQEE